MKKLLFLALAILSITVACKKVEGEGGRSSITGKVLIKEKLYINGVCTDTAIYDGAKEDVYIIYGDNETMYDDKIECSYDGSFKFSFLEPGKYTVFAYNKIFHTGNNIPNNDDDYYTNEAVSYSVTLEKKSTNDLGTITLWK